MSKTFNWILGLLCTVILTFAFYTMLKFLTEKPESKAQQEISVAAPFTGEHMTPEVLLSLGRITDAQLSPDGKTILYGVSYTSNRRYITIVGYDTWRTWDTVCPNI